MTKIAAFATIGEAVRVIGGNLGPLIAFSWLPVILYFLLSGPLDTFFYFSEEIGPWWSFAAAGLGEMALAIVLVPVYLAWHRLTLGLKTESGGLGLAAIRHVDGRYVVCTMSIYAPFTPLFLGIWATAQFADDDGMTTTNLLIVGGILAFVALWFWFAMRMSFVFVEIAIGAYDGFSKAWTVTRGHVPKLTIIGVTASVPILAIVLFVLALDDVEGPASLTALAAQCLAALIAGAFWVSATSIAYRDVTGWNNKDVAEIFE